MRVADLGCGVGGPLREIARFSGATIVGVNNNEYQLETARKLTGEAGLGHLAEFLKCDFMHMDAPDDSFDAAYAIEATVHAPTKVGCYGEVFRVLKPGGCFAAYEYCLTSRFDANNPRHQQIKSDLEVGGALPDIAFPHQVDDALRQVGFELLETGDLAEKPGPGIPWYHPLAGSRFSFASFRSSKAGRMATHGTLQLLEALRIVPTGTVRVSGLLNLCATAMVASGRLGIFTPMYFVYARKPQ
jgi:sterol 24-C-methyltransferase